MTPFILLIILITQLCAVTGQIFVKKSRMLPESAGKRKATILMVSGIAAMTVGFFLWLGLLKRFPLSYLFPFEALHYIFIIMAAGFFLKERTSLSLLIGCGLICAGIVLVGTSE